MSHDLCRGHHRELVPSDDQGSLRQPRPIPGANTNRSRRRFLLGGVGALAGVALGTLLSDVAAAQDTNVGDGDGGGASDTDPGQGSGDVPEADQDDQVSQDELSTSPTLPAYRNRPGWGAEEGLRFGADGVVSYPMAFFPVQKVIIHHTGTWAPEGGEGAADLVQAVYREHVAREFGDIGYHLLIAPDGTVFEGRYSGGVSFPLYDNYPGNDPGGPRLVNAAHTYNHNAGNVGIAVMGDYEEQDLSPAAWSSLVTTVALICANTGLDPHGESLYRNPINGLERVMSNVCPHRSVVGTYCPGAAITDRFDELRSSVAELASRLDRSTWLESATA